ncbi:membrane dipeptidase [Colletotrichum musicola]|uniref:Dipeptidase n=1 Tax=Colletotrichum musicola TaxID=2175873 RepID=A0A8H6JNU4_9PEZI|nr:membrane dipeptidase [Colletotrichum musicola]
MLTRQPGSLCAGCHWLVSYHRFHPAPLDRWRRAALLTCTPTQDGHNDFAWMVRGWLRNRIDHASEGAIQNMPIGQTDVRRLREGQVGCQFWSAFVPDHGGDDTDIEPLLETLRTTLQQIDVLHTLFERHPATFGFVDRADDILPVFRSGRIASLLGIEGLHQIANSASVLRMYHRLGVRYATLCHDKNNIYCESAQNAEPSARGGLSDEGRAMITEMNRIGMMVDLSHTSHKTQLDVLVLSRAPVLFSHSSCFSLCNHRRNVTDEALDKLGENGGIIMICFLPSLVDAGDGSKPTVGQIADHVEYAGRRIGYDHVGIGSDFDGMLEGPEGMDDVSQHPQLVAELIRRGRGEKELAGILGLNLIRVLKRAEETAREMESEEILFDEHPEVWTKEQKTILTEAGRMRQAHRKRT